MRHSDRLRLLLTKDTDECVLWDGGLTDKGYGRFTLDGVQTRAHRVAFLWTYGTEPAVVRHKCDTPACVNPRHLEAGTQDDNMKDMASRHRSRRYKDLTPEHVLAIALAPGTQVSIAKQYGITQPRVSKIKIAHRSTYVPRP